MLRGSELSLLLLAACLWRPVYGDKPTVAVKTGEMKRGLGMRSKGRCLPTAPLCMNAYALEDLNELRAASKAKPLKMGSEMMTRDAIMLAKKMSKENRLIESDLMKINNAGHYKCGEFLAGEFVAERDLPPPAELDIRDVVPMPDYTDICVKHWAGLPKHLDAMTFDRIDDVSFGAYVDTDKNVVWCALLLAVNTYPTCRRSPTLKDGRFGNNNSNSNTLGAASTNGTTEGNPFATPTASPSKSLGPATEIDIASYKYEYKLVTVKYPDGANAYVKLLCLGSKCRYCIVDKTWCYTAAFSVLVDSYLKIAIGKPKLF